MTRPSLFQFAKFAAVGGMAFVLDAGGYYVFTRMLHIPYLAARGLSLGCALVWNFSLNRYWTYNAAKGDMAVQALRFLVVMGSTSLLSIGMLRLAVGHFRLPDMQSLVVISVGIAIINYFIHRSWSYRLTGREYAV